VDPRPSAAGRGECTARQVIINADDFGMSAEIDRGILEAHDRGVVTSTSLMVNDPDAEGAIDQARRRPGLSLGIHWPSIAAASGSWMSRISRPSSGGLTTSSLGSSG
jgi:predicted glycoside hydrolase/deacetylase ChbG (UPF0249 family)